MQVIRTIIWVVLLIAVVVFSIFNWNPVEVTIWDNLVLETKVPALVIISFLLGFLPTWLISRGVIWSLNRKIRSLEIAAKASSVSAAAREAEREESARQELAETEAEAEAETEAEAEEAVEETASEEPIVEEPAAEEPLASEPVTAETTSEDVAASDDADGDASDVDATDEISADPKEGGNGDEHQKDASSPT